MMQNAQQVIDTLKLEAHIEGGYYRRTYASTANTTVENGDIRPLCSSIFYLLSTARPIGHFHRNQSDIVHYYHGGETIRYWLIDLHGQLSQVDMGWDLDTGQVLQLTVPGGYWKASELISARSTEEAFGLISEAVTPGFDFADMEIATVTQMKSSFPQLMPRIKRLIRPKE
jgi:hypothetical protein